MSSNPLNSSADRSVSNPNAAPVRNHTDSSMHVDVLVSFLSNSIELELPLSELDINPETSPALENIKLQTDGIAHDTCNAYIKLIAIAESNHSQMEKFLNKSKNNKPIPPDMLNTQQKELRGGVAVFNEHHKSVSKKVDFVKKSLNILSAEILRAFEDFEKAQFRQGQLNAIKDNAVPAVSAINPMLAPAESAAKVAVGLVAHYVSSGFDNRLKELGITDKKLRQDVLIAIATKSRLESYQRETDKAQESWDYSCNLIYAIQKAEDGTDTEANRIELIGKRILDFISPIKAYLAKVYPIYAPGIDIVREAKTFCNTVPKIPEYVNIIGSAKIIIKGSHRYRYENTVNELGLAIFAYLESMRMVFIQDPMDPASLEQLSQDLTLKFIGDTKVSIYELRRLLDKHTSKSKSKDAEKERMTGDRCFDSLEWVNRPAVNPEGVRLQLNRVEAGIRAIYHMSTASLGKTVRTIDGGIERSHVELDVTNSSLSQVHQVLNEDIEEGLKYFQNQQMVEKPSLIQRALDHMPFHHKER